MLKQYQGLIGGGLALILVCGIGYGLYRLPALVMDDAFEIEPTLVESQSPSGQGTAAFLRESGMTAGSVYFYVRDSSRSSRPLAVGEGYASDGGVKMEQAIWSGDGSIVAVRAKMGETSGHQFSKFYGTFFLDAYDFKTHRPVGVGFSVRNKSRAIKALIGSRGGEGEVALKHPYGDEREVVLNRGQMEEFKRVDY